MRVASLFSGGKDSIYAILKAMKAGLEIRYLITIAPKRSDSWMFHYPCVELTKLQAKAMGIKQIFMETRGVKEKELEDLKRALAAVQDEIDGVVSGAVASQYQKSRVDRVCNELGLKSFAPLWQKDPEKLLKEEVSVGFKIIMVSVSCDGLTKEWLGRILDKKAVEELIELSRKYGFNPVGEGGEYETFVVDCPLFRWEVKLPKFEIVWDEATSSGFLKFKTSKV